LNIELSQEEKDMLINFEQDVNKIVKAVAKEEQKTESSKEKSADPELKSEKSDENKELEVQETKAPRQKKEFKVKMEEDAPQ
jgi:hypothetical protein